MENIDGYEVTISYEEIDKVILQELKVIINNETEEKFRLAAEILLEYYGETLED